MTAPGFMLVIRTWMGISNSVPWAQTFALVGLALSPAVRRACGHTAAIGGADPRSIEVILPLVGCPVLGRHADTQGTPRIDDDTYVITLGPAPPGSSSLRRAGRGARWIFAKAGCHLLSWYHGGTAGGPNVFRGTCCFWHYPNEWGLRGSVA